MYYRSLRYKRFNQTGQQPETYDRRKEGDSVTDVKLAFSKYDEDAIFERTVEDICTL